MTDAPTLTPEKIAELEALLEAARSEPRGVGLDREGNFQQPASIDRLERAMWNALPALLDDWRRMREALELAANRLEIAASRIDRADTEFGVRVWAEEVRAALGGRNER